MSVLHSRSRKASQISGGPLLGSIRARFDATSGATGEVASDDDADILAAFPDVQEVGDLGLDETEGTAGNAGLIITVPAGKYWRLIGMVHRLVTDANAADRILVVDIRDSSDATIETVSHVAVAASTTVMRVTHFGEDVAGDAADKALGTGVDFPVVGPYLQPAEDIEISVTDGVAGDSYDVYLLYISYDNDPR
jgi:archaellum component FlaF (FlaF/FlaG flagellin family)